MCQEKPNRAVAPAVNARNSFFPVFKVPIKEAKQNIKNLNFLFLFL